MHFNRDQTIMKTRCLEGLIRRTLPVCALISILLLGCTAQQIDLKTRQAILISGVDDEKLAMSLQKGREAHEGKNYSLALETFHQAGSISRSSREKKQVAELVNLYALDLYKQKRFETALSYFDLSTRYYEQINYPDDLIVNYSYMAKINADLGRHYDAIADLKKAIALQKNDKYKAGLARNTNNLANLHSFLGEYPQAHAILNDALLLSESLNNPELIATTQVNLATALYHLRQYGESVDFLNRAIEICEDRQLDRLKTTALIVRGGVYRQQGDFEKALNDYREAISISREIKADEELSFALGTLGELYKETDRLDEAADAIEQSYRLSKSQNNILMQGASLYYLAEVRYKQKQYGSAVTHYESSNRIFSGIDYRDGMARNLIGIGFVALQRKEYDTALFNFEKAVEIYEALGDREWIRVALFGKARSLEEKGNLAQAETTYKRAVDVFESIRKDVSGGDDARELFSLVNEALYERLVAMLLKMGKVRDASEYIERSRSKRLRDTLLNSGVSSADNALRILLEQYDNLSKEESAISKTIARERSSPQPDVQKIKNLQSTLVKVQSDFKMVVDTMQREYPRAIYLLGISPKGLSELRRSNAIPSSMAILQYFITAKTAYVFIATQKSLAVEPISIDKEQLEHLVVSYRKAIIKSKNTGTSSAGGSLNQNADVNRASTALYDLLIKPALPHLTKSDAIAIIPFGVLNLVPFHALGHTESGSTKFKYLIQEKDVIFLTSATYLRMLKSNRSGHNIERIAAFGNPELGIDQLRLPFAEAEVKIIKTIYPQADIYLKKDATKKRFHSSWGKYQVIHLAAHGKFDQVKGARILLAPIYGGNLTTEFITGLQDAQRTEMVILSACETAVYHEMKDENVNQLPSLALSFTWVGIPSVLATLWRVEDEATSILMEKFYRNLKNNLGIYTALKTAQLAMIEDGKHASPYYWAPVILFGAWL